MRFTKADEYQFLYRCGAALRYASSRKRGCRLRAISDCRVASRSEFLTSPGTRRAPKRRSLRLKKWSAKYPNSEYAIERTRRKLEIGARPAGRPRGHGWGRYYMERRDYTERHQSLQGVVTPLSDHPPCRGSADRLTEGYIALGIVGEAQTAAAVLGHNFPDTPLVQGRL